MHNRSSLTMLFFVSMSSNRLFSLRQVMEEWDLTRKPRIPWAYEGFVESASQNVLTRCFKDTIIFLYCTKTNIQIPTTISLEIYKHSFIEHYYFPVEYVFTKNYCTVEFKSLLKRLDNFKECLTV